MSTSSSPHSEPSELQGTDGWTDGAVIRSGDAFKALIKRPSAKLTPRDLAARARANALLMHMSLLCGFPIFLFAFFKRDDPLVLHHAKAAAVAFLLFYAALIFGVIWEPIYFWGALMMYIPSLIGVWRACAGERVGLLGFGQVGEALFFPLQPKVRRSKPPHLLR